MLGEIASRGVDHPLGDTFPTEDLMFFGLGFSTVFVHICFTTLSVLHDLIL
jgi:hypothetical protein